MTKIKKFKKKKKRNEDYQINTVIEFYFQIKHMCQHKNEDYLLCDSLVKVMEEYKKLKLKLTRK